MVILSSRPPRPQPPSAEGGPWSRTPQLESRGETPGAQRSPSQTGQPAELPAPLHLRVSLPVGSSDLVPKEGPAGWNTGPAGAAVRLLETICVLVTLLSLLRCLPPLQRLATGQRRPMDSFISGSTLALTTFPSSEGLRMGGPHAPPPPFPEASCIYYFGV